jgi:hypothetical protein
MAKVPLLMILTEATNEFEDSEPFDSVFPFLYTLAYTMYHSISWVCGKSSTRHCAKGYFERLSGCGGNGARGAGSGGGGNELS